MKEECFACQRHTLFRVVLQFKRQAVITGNARALLKKFHDLGILAGNLAYINWETPELTPHSMKGGVATIIIDKQLPNQQKRTALKFAKEIDKLIDKTDLDEGFVDIFSLEDRRELLDWEEYKPACTTRVKKKAKTK